MKTTLSLPDSYHRSLRKIAIDRSVTMAALICEAIKEKFFMGSLIDDRTDIMPLQKTRGILKDKPSTAKEIRLLKKVWRTRG